MKQLSCRIMTLILLLGCISFYQEVAHADTADVEIKGQIGSNATAEQTPREPIGKPTTNLAQPKQSHIKLRTFPNTGSIIERYIPLGLLLLLSYVLLSRWKAHRNRQL